MPTDSVNREARTERLAEVQRQLTEASEVIAVADRDSLGTWLATLKELAATKSVILMVRELPTLMALQEMVTAGIQVFLAPIAKKPPFIILDRRKGYWLPGWDEIPHARHEAVHLLWRRMGYLDVIQGTVETSDGIRAFALAEFPLFRISLSPGSPSAPLPQIGQRLQLAVHYPFGASLLPPYLLYTWESKPIADGAI